MESVLMPDFLTHGWTFQATGLFGVETLFTADPENIRAIFAMQFKDFTAGENRRRAFGPFIGNCIFTTDGPFWEHSRALFRPHFSTGQVNNLQATEKAVQDFLTALEAKDWTTEQQDQDQDQDRGQERQWSGEVDLQPLFQRFTLDGATEFLFGSSVQSQLAAIPGAISLVENEKIDHISQMAADAAGGGDDDINFSQAFHVVSVEVTKRAKLQSLYWLAYSKKALRAVKYLRRFVDHFVDQTLQCGAVAEPHDIEKDQHHTLLSALARGVRDPIEIRDQVLFTLVASRDTTAAMLSWMFLMLAKHPVVFAKLRSEILAEFGLNTTTDEGSLPLTMQSLKRCRYLQWTMSETLRLYPPAPLGSRVAARDTTLPTGGGANGKSPIAVRKGQVINLCVYAMQRREDLWGEDVLEFKPERWEEKKPDWTFLPFSGGPRTCLGSRSDLIPPFHPSP